MIFMAENSKPKSLILFSGGLDSILAARTLQEQGVEVQGLTFVSSFFDSVQAKEAAKKLGIKLKTVDFSKEHLKIVKRPKYGYGKNMNPCIDCHLLMLKTAKKIIEKEKFDFLATGEVLGERPMSQNRKALELIEKESGLFGYLLRPLSAKLLKPTEVEKNGVVDREKLLDIRGRSRKKQLSLAKQWKIKEYPTPAGGCLLTDPEFSKRLKDLLAKNPRANKNDIELLKLGRHFWQGKDKIIIGRNEQENEKLKQLKQRNDILIEMENYAGPTALIKKYGSKTSIQTKKRAKELVQLYSAKARHKKDIKFRC
jgi:tRNA-uridine 2-sulfurtransferase